MTKQKEAAGSGGRAGGRPISGIKPSFWFNNNKK